MRSFPMRDMRSTRGRCAAPRRHAQGAVRTILHIDIRPAVPGDEDAVVGLLSVAAAWTASIGFLNWAHRFPRNVVTRAIAAGELYVAQEDDSIVATVTLQWSDAMLWGDREDDAGYVHRLAVRRDRAGAGLGTALVDWATQEVRARGRDWLRLDASADNLPLCAYYEGLGFEHRGEVEGELTGADGKVKHWRSRLYERGCNEEKRG